MVPCRYTRLCARTLFAPFRRFSLCEPPYLTSHRLYAHCARTDFYNFPEGAVVLFYLNLEDNRRTLTLTQYEGHELHMFLLTPGDDDGLTSRTVKLNGDVLLMEGDTLPQMTFKTRRGDVKVTGRSFGFIVVPNAKVAVCRSQGR